MQILSAVVFSVLGIIAFLFIFWRHLKEDYIDNQIFSVSLISILGFMSGFFLAHFFLPPWSFWLSFSLGASGLILGIFKYGIKFFEAVEAWVSSILVLFFLVNIHYLIVSKNIQVLSYSLFLLLLVVLYIYLDSHYKKILWYKSGKAGFTGMFILGVFFLVRSVVALVAPNMVFFFVSYDPLISGIIAFISFLTIINLSRV